MVSTGGSFIWLPTIIQRAGISDITEVGLLSAFPFIVGLIAQFVVAPATRIAYSSAVGMRQFAQRPGESVGCCCLLSPRIPPRRFCS